MSWRTDSDKGGNDPPQRKKHSLQSVYRKDPRSNEERKDGHGRHGMHPARNRRYSCSCGVDYGNVSEREAADAHRAHKRRVGA